MVLTNVAAAARDDDLDDILEHLLGAHVEEGLYVVADAQEDTVIDEFLAHNPGDKTAHAEEMAGILAGAGYAGAPTKRLPLCSTQDDQLVLMHRLLEKFNIALTRKVGVG